MARSDPLPPFDLYRELGVDRTAGPTEIEAAWRAAMRRTHPDVAGASASATQRAARLNVARDWLLDPRRRAVYDDVRFGEPGGSPKPAAPMPDIDPLGTWPARRATSRASGPGPGVFATLGLMAVVFAVTVGIGSNFLTLAAFMLGGLLLIFFGLLLVLGLFFGGR